MRPADKPSSLPHRGIETPKASRVDLVIEHVKNQISEGIWTSGSRLPNENEVAKALGVSRTPVREAIKILAAAGLLETRQGHGTFVRSRISVSALQLALFQIYLEKTTPQKLMEVRELFEVACVELAAQRRNSNDLVAMELAIQRLREEAAKRPLDRTAALEADIAFHRAVYAATHNELIQAIANLMLEMITPYIGKSHEAGQLQQSIRLHEMMLEAIAAHDGADQKLMRSVRANMDHFRQTLELRAPPPKKTRNRASGVAR
jgi:GntR family transcriptional repressor for pyruvate dehydrogenase complex